MTHNTNTQYQDTKIDTKIVLAGLWAAVVLLFAYVDIFAHFRADVVQGALDGEIAGQGITIGQGFLAAATAFVGIPILMIPISLLAKAKTIRITNLIVSGVYAVAVAGFCIGEEWYYYLMGSFFEVLLLAIIFKIAWQWPTQTTASKPLKASGFEDRTNNFPMAEMHS